MALSFAFDASKETPQSTAAKRALIAQLMGTIRAPKTIGEGFSAIGDGIVANVEGGRAREAETAGRESADSTFGKLTAMLTGQGGATPSAGVSGAPASVPTGADAASIRAGMIARGLPEHIADGFLMNFQDESGLNPGINEQNPTVPGSRGGYGLYQLTGPRRVAYEQYAQQMGVDPSNVDAQLDFMMSELQGSEANAAKSIFGTQDAGSAAAAIATNFLRPAKQHLDARVSRYTAGGGQAAPVQVASLDPSIGMPQAQPAQLPPIGPSGGPQMAAAPQQPGMVPQMPPMQPQTPMVPQQQPMQTAQGPSLQMLMEAAANPWLNEGQRGIVNSMIAQEMQRQDPMYQMGLEKSQLELEAMRNPGKKPPIEVGGVLVDPDTFQPVFDSRQPSDNGFTLSPGQQRFDAQGNPIASAQPDPGYRLMTPAELQSVPGLDPRKAYQVGPDNKISEISGGGVNVSVGGNNDIGTIPPGKMVTRDAQGNVTGMVDIPGGPSEAAATAAAEAAAAGQGTKQLYGNVVVEDIDRALDILDNDATWTTGILGQVMGNLKGSNADRLDNLINTVKANSAFDRLQAMRDASPTGGALGAVSAPELLLLESAIGSLERSNKDDLAFNLKRVQQIYSDIVNGPQAAPNQSQAVPGIESLLEKYQ